MGIILKKELTSVFSSPVSLFFMLAFLLTCGLMNWFFAGSFNILDNGYANLNKFFELASIVLLLFTPALTMRSFSEEKRSGSLTIFRSFPKRISSWFIGKLIALWIVILASLIISSIYVYAVYTLSLPAGNIDINEIIASYFSLSLLSLVFVAAGLFSSSLTRNQIVAFLLALFFNFLIFYGFDMLGALFSSGKMQLIVSSLGLHTHYKLMGKGVIEFKGLLIAINYIFLFSIISVYILNLKNKKSRKNAAISVSLLLLLNVISLFVPDYRWDFTSDRRYTLSEYSKNMLQQVSDREENIHFNVYLSGDLNTGFQRLQLAIEEMLSDFGRNSRHTVTYSFINPNSLADSQDEIYKQMWDRQMKGIVLNETDREGKSSRRIIYPYAEALRGNDTLQLNLLKNIAGYTAEENLNASIENLEFEFADAIRLFSKTEPDAIAFIEGHGELERPFVYDAEELLSKYYFVNRGRITGEISALDGFKVVIIAGASAKFSEKEKFVIDQYIMSGGRVLWLVDGVYLSSDELRNHSQSPAIKNETNLDDLFFNYGVRINPVLLQDAQSTKVLLTTGDQGAGRYSELPWYYSLLLLPSFDHPVTKDISLVKGAFASSIDIIDRSAEVKKDVLLTTSLHSHIVPVPEIIDFEVAAIQSDPHYFDQSFIPVSVSLEGTFNSAYANRMIPDSVEIQSRKPAVKSIPTKMIFVSASDIIKNELINDGMQTQVLPMGFDRVSERQYGNRDFIVNAVNWLASDDDWLSLRSKEQQIRLLDRQLIYSERNKWAMINIGFPIVTVLLLAGAFHFYRKRRYEK